MSTETTLGVVFVIVVVMVALGLWIGLDKRVRRTLLRWGGCAGLREKRKRAAAAAAASRGRGKERAPRKQTGVSGDAEKVVRPMPLVLQGTEDSQASSSSSVPKSVQREAHVPTFPTV